MQNAAVKNTGKAKMLFWVFLAIMIVFMVVKPEWFWVWLPFVCTYFVQMMDWM